MPFSVIKIISSSSFNDGKECESWLDIRGADEKEANDIVHSLFEDVSNITGSDFNLEVEISPYDESNRKLLYVINPFTESHPISGNHFDHCCRWRFGKYVKDGRLGDLVEGLFVNPRLKAS